MNLQLLFRIMLGLFAAGVMGGTVFLRRNRDQRAALTGHDGAFKPMLNPVFLPLALAVLIPIVPLCTSGRQAQGVILTFWFDILLQLLLYYGIMLPLLPVLRRYFSTHAIVTLWLLPNLAYLATQPILTYAKPLWVLTVPGNAVGIVFWVWLAGFCAVLGWHIIGHLLLRRRLLKGCRPITDRRWLEIWKAELMRAHISPSQYRWGFPLVTSAKTQTPLTIGLFHITYYVVLPVRDYAPQELTLIFRHEILHIGRRDGLTKFFLAFCTAVCWFNPLMWLAMARCAEDLELSCDEAVLACQDPAVRQQYADLLLRTAGHSQGFTTCLSATARALLYRLKNVVSPPRRKVGGLLVGLFAFALILSCGHGALAYRQGSGNTFLFPEGTDAYSIQIAQLTHEDLLLEQGEPEAAEPLIEYLAALPMYRITGSYTLETAENHLFFICSSPGSYRHVILTDQYLSVTQRRGSQEDYAVYYCPDPIDWALLEALLSAEP